MDKTLDIFKNADDEYLINHNRYMEEVVEKNKEGDSKQEDAQKEVKTEKPKK